YYAGRFGEYAKSDDFLPAIVEARPGSSDAYFTLAEINGSMEDYRRALELDPTRADVHDRMKDWPEGKAALEVMRNRALVTQKFWTDFSDLLRHIGQEKALARVRADLDKLLRLYIRRNGAFQIDGLMQGVLAAGGDVAWVVDLSRSAADPVQFLSAIVEQPWVPEAQRDLIYRRMVESAKEFEGPRWRVAWAENSLKRGDVRRAAEVMSPLPDEDQYLSLRLRIADKVGNVRALLARYQGPLDVLPMD